MAQWEAIFCKRVCYGVEWWTWSWGSCSLWPHLSVYPEPLTYNSFGPMGEIPINLNFLFAVVSGIQKGCTSGTKNFYLPSPSHPKVLFDPICSVLLSYKLRSTVFFLFLNPLRTVCKYVSQKYLQIKELVFLKCQHILLHTAQVSVGKLTMMAII